MAISLGLYFWFMRLCKASYPVDTTFDINALPFPCAPGDCLLDEPAKPILLPADFPGQASLYSLDHQCQQIFGKTFRHCANTTHEDICSQLWCKLDTGERLCQTKNGSLPWADGTPCGARKMCLDGQCVLEAAVLPQVTL